jgi:hypothetical protein
MSGAEKEAYTMDLLRMFKNNVDRRTIDAKYGLIPD